MEVELEMRGVVFVWDSDKAAENLKHGVTFEEAAAVFFDPFVRVVDAERNNESRLAAIGYDGLQRMLFVVHLHFEGDRLRIISARRAERAERKIYETD